MIEQALGESSHLRYRSTTLQAAVRGLIAALAGWRGVAAHLRRLPDDMGKQGTEFILSGIPPELRSVWEPNSPKRWIADPVSLQSACEEGERTLLALKTETPSQRLLADETAQVLNGMGRVLDGLALLVDTQAGRLPEVATPRWASPIGYRRASMGFARSLRLVQLSCSV